MGGDRARGKDWLRARGMTCVLQTQFSSFFFFFFWGGGGGESRRTWPFTLREYWKITHYFRAQKQC